MSPHPIRHLFSARSSQSTVLLTPGSYPPCSDSIPTRSAHPMRKQWPVSHSRPKRGEGEKTYVSVRFFANELVLECCVRGQIHRRAPHRVMDWIQWDLFAVVSVRCLQNPHAHVPHWTDPSSRVAAHYPRRRCSSPWLIVNVRAVGARNRWALTSPGMVVAVS
jgi:hypothetical protein